MISLKIILTRYAPEAHCTQRIGPYTCKKKPILNKWRVEMNKSCEFWSTICIYDHPLLAGDSMALLFKNRKCATESGVCKFTYSNKNSRRFKLRLMQSVTIVPLTRMYRCPFVRGLLRLWQFGSCQKLPRCSLHVEADLAILQSHNKLCRQRSSTAVWLCHVFRPRRCLLSCFTMCICRATRALLQEWVAHTRNSVGRRNGMGCWLPSSSWFFPRF